MESIVNNATQWLIHFVSDMGYLGIILIMAVDSTSVPLPSELIMSFCGYLAGKHPERFSFWGMGFSGSLGCVLGSAITYWIGWLGGKPFVERFGRFMLIRKEHIDQAEKWFDRYGSAAVFISRLIPGFRAFISFPAGAAGMHFGKFIIYTFIGSLSWCLVLAYIGRELGDKWNTIGSVLHKPVFLIAALLIMLSIMFIYWWSKRRSSVCSGYRMEKELEVSQEAEKTEEEACAV